jgi:AraC family transcriptional regulator of adaptative response / DNA-3-methyladenine glycosylase II
MTLDPDVCYRALRSRDPRFDGRFFTGVLTTGIYCRPVCPARTPQRRNVRFYASAAAAADEGFRPCRRCRPEAAPGTAAWSGTSAAVARALRLIGEGVLDTGSVGELAGRVGLGERQLRRLFVQHLGAGPLAVAATRRAHLAKKLLDETDLPATRIAFAAGYASVRRFNAAVRDAFQASPRELRAARRRGGAVRPADATGAVELRLAYRPPLDWGALLAFLAPRALPGVEEVEPTGPRKRSGRGGCYRRVACFDGECGVVAVRDAGDSRHLVLQVPANLTRAIAVLATRARRLFDLDADPAAIRTHLRRDPALRPRVRPGLRVPGAWDGFEVAVRAILGQQVSVAGATTLAGRLVERFGTPLPEAAAAGSLTRVFPDAAALAGADLRAIGLPAARARAIAALAEAVAAGRLVLAPHADPDKTRTALLALPGVGPWTAAYLALRALGDPDALPASDLGLRRALAGSDGSLPAPAEIEARAEAWRPWRGYAALALWGAGRV